MFDTLKGQLEGLAPGPELGTALSRIDISTLSGYDRVVVLQAHRKMASHHAAQAYGAMVGISEVTHGMFDDDVGLASRAAATEIRAALALTRRSADVELDLALDLQVRLPKVWDALDRGAIDVPKARVLVNGTGHLSVTLAQDVSGRVLENASGLTTGQLRARITKLSVAADPDDAKQRYEAAVEGRRVVLEANPDGPAHLTGYDLPADRAQAIASTINRLAQKPKTKHETRTMDQLRADVFLDLLDGHHGGRNQGRHNRRGHDRGVVDIHVDLTTLIGLSDQAGELAGFGPVIADLARQITEHQHRSQWRWTVTDPDTGMPLHEGVTRRRPDARRRRQVEARDRTCVFPGCRTPARHCDLDHRIPWSKGGRTCPRYLAPVCRHDHTNRHPAAGPTDRSETATTCGPAPRPPLHHQRPTALTCADASPRKTAHDLLPNHHGLRAESVTPTP
jgi:hypothetical protein